jgi:hypothetical protein
MPGPHYRKNAAGFVIFFFAMIFVALMSSCNRSHSNAANNPGAQLTALQSVH